MGMIEEISELTRKAERYNIVKENNDKAQEKIKEAISNMQESLKILNPIVVMKDGNNMAKQRVHASRDDIVIGLHEKYYNGLRMGLEVSKEQIMRENPELTDKQVFNLFNNRLKHSPKVQWRKINNAEGRATMLFMDKTP